MLCNVIRGWPLLAILVFLYPACSRSAPRTGTGPSPPNGTPNESWPAEIVESDFGPESAVAAIDSPPAAAEVISGKIVLPPSRRARVAKGDTIFVSARRSVLLPGGGSLLAAQRLQADEFPLLFTLSARDAMIPGTAFAGPVTIAVRVDKDGDPLTRQKGDLYGQAMNVPVGTAQLVVSLDSVQSDDVTLGGGPSLDQGGLPPGHP